MPLRKTAIAVSEDLLRAIDRMADERGESRNALINRVLGAAVRARHDREITRRLNEIFGDEEVGAQQLAAADDLNRAGADWSDERW